MEVIKKLSPLLQQPFSKELLLGIQPLRLELSKEVVDLGQKLAERKRQVLWPKDKEMTELDRKIRLDADVAQLERDYEFLLKVELIISDLVKLSGFIR